MEFENHPDLTIRNALIFAAKKHDGQKRKGGEPYIIHPIAVCKYVSEKGFGNEYMITALFHDLLEDTDATEEEILNLGGEKVLEAVKLLTKKDGYIMEEYVEGIKNNPIAFRIKIADRLHNLRSAICTDDEFKRRYILETIDHYLTWSDEIKLATKDLAMSMTKPMTDFPFLYEPIDSWTLD